MKRKTILGAGFLSTTALAPGGNVNFPITFGRLTSTGTYAQRAHAIRMNGTLKKLVVYEPFNTLSTADTTITLQLDNVDTALTLTVPAGGEAVYEIETDVAVTDTEALTLSVAVAAGGTGSIYPFNIYAVFENDLDETYQWHEKVIGNPGISTNSATRFNGMAGGANTGTTFSEAGQNRLALVDADISNYAVAVTANTRVTNTVFTASKNSASTTLSVTFGGGVTGVIEDTSNTDSLIGGTDEYAQQFVTGTSGGSLNFGMGGVLLTSTEGAQLSSQDGQNVVSFTASDTPSFYPLCGALATSTDADRCSIRAEFPMRLTGLHTRCTSFFTTSNPTLGVYVNGVLSALFVTITGVANFTNLSDTVDVDEGDLITVGIVGGTSGTFNFSRIQVAYQDMTPTPPAPSVNQQPISRLNLGLGIGLTRYT